ncbi:ATP-dependent RNA helicase HrpA [Luminiphilus sp.]|nr:ATP-dependent RNA helicase HrpA [Luminiphilus sp.]
MRREPQEQQVERLTPQRIDYPESLPVVARKEDIMRAISAHQVVIVAGETGSGKTTQLPKMCLELGRGKYKRIGHTQPRRIAARAVSSRIAEELKTSVGQLVGYQVRFNDDVTDQTAVKVMTDGILLAELSRDRQLQAYDTLIIDEAHERSLNIDFILGYLKRLLPKRPDLKIIITSATIDVERFSKHFNDAPIIEVSGRTFPVEVRYLDSVEDRDRGVQQQVVQLVDEIAEEHYGPRGDILVFCPGERQIRDLAKALRGRDRIQVLPLYARLSNAEQNRVFNPSGRGLRVVLATNVAETSLTVPGIRYVIDPGDARISRYSHRSGLQRLPIESISQASANQRKGRCGRVAEGVCFRLYSEEDFLARPEFTDAEILRTHLASVILRMLELGLGDVRKFPFVDPPDAKMVRDGFRLLTELGAVDAHAKLTPIGRAMAKLPVDPKLGRILLDATSRDCLNEGLVIVSALSVQDPRERPSEKRAQSDQQHARFNDSRSDFMAWLNLWRYLEEQRQALTQNQLRKMCEREFLSYLRVREWREVHYQLVISCRQMNFRVAPMKADDEQYAAIHRALLTGLLGNVAQQDEGRRFNAARNRKAQVFPASSQYKKPPKWLMAAELVETSQVFARQCAAIEPEWLLETNPRLLKRHHYEPAWSARSGRVMAKERVSLFGLTVSDGQRVHYASIDQKTSREIMIRDGLVSNNFRQAPGFLKHNQTLVSEVMALESRVRRRDLLVDDESMVRFYDERLPEDCASAVALDKWLRRDGTADSSLRMKREQVLTRDPGGEVEAQFPKTLDSKGVSFQLVYQFEPGGQQDGVSVIIPRALLNRAPRYLFEWLVPGLLRDKLIALIKALPKALRKQLVPAPDVADALLERLITNDEPLSQALSREIKVLRGVSVSLRDWEQVALEPFYQMNIRVVDDRKKVLAEGRDLKTLVAQFRTESPVEVVTTRNNLERVNVTRWDFQTLPTEWRGKSAGTEVLAYPAVIKEGSGQLAIRLLDYPSEADRQHRLGVAGLLLQSDLKTAKYLKKQLFVDNAATLSLAGARLEREPLIDALIEGGLWRLLEGRALPRSPEQFAEAQRVVTAQWVPHVLEMGNHLMVAVKTAAQASATLARYKVSEYAASRADMTAQLQALFEAKRLVETPTQYLSYYPRYLKALLNRAERLSAQGSKDEKSMAMLALQLERLAKGRRDYPGLEVLSPEAVQFRWMLEEFRVSLFAQQLGTKLPVSAKRLDQQWQSVEQWMTNNPR